MKPARSLMKPLGTCAQVSRLVSEGMDRELGTLERTRVRMHLWICSGCTNFSKQVRILREAIRKAD